MNLPALPLPSSLKALSYTPAGLVRRGADYETGAGFPWHNVAVDGAVCTYSPDWAGAHKTPFYLAYACYAFDMDGYDLAHQIAFTWEQQGAAGDMWIGLADFTRDVWTWRALPAGGILACDLTPFIDAQTHTMLVLPLATGVSPWRLVSIHVGDLSSLSGQVFQADGVTPLANAAVAVTGAQEYGASTDATGAWSIHGVLPGDYVIAASLVGWQFTPASLAVSISALEHVIEDFVGTPAQTYVISGSAASLPDYEPLPGVRIEITPESAPADVVFAMTDLAGDWSIALPDGDYTAVPSLADWNFIPPLRSFSVAGADEAVAVFTGEQLPGYQLDGYIYLEDGITPVPGIQISALHEDFMLNFHTQTDSNGYWSIADVPEGVVLVRPYLDGWRITPETRYATVEGADFRVDPFTAEERVPCQVVGFVYLDDGVTPLPDIQIWLSDGFDNYYTWTAWSGVYFYNEILSGEYTVTPVSALYDFTPTSQVLTISGDTTVPTFFATIKAG